MNRTFVPVPIGCVALGFAGLGLLLQPVVGWGMYLCGTVSCLCLALLSGTLFSSKGPRLPQDVVGLSVLCAVPMTLMLLSAYCSGLTLVGARLLWWMGVLGHLALMICFTRNYVGKFSLSQVYGCWFLPYVGIAAAGISAGKIGLSAVAVPLVLLGLICFPLVLVLLVLRHCKCPPPSPGQKPLLCICAAPASLCITGAIKTDLPLSHTLLTALYLLAAVLYAIALGNCVLIFIKDRSFYPSHSAFTFPFVISATASGSVRQLPDLAIAPLAGWLFPLQRSIAAALCLFVLGEYVWFLCCRKDHT